MRDPNHILYEIFRSRLSVDQAAADLRNEPEVFLKLLDENSERLGEVDEKILGKVYRILFDAASARSATETETTGVQSDDAVIGKEFTWTLLRDLPPKEKDFQAIFDGATTQPPEIERAIAEHESTLAAGEPARKLAHFGLTPVTFVDAGSAMSALIHRFYDHNEVPRDQKVVLEEKSRSAASSHFPVVPRVDLIDEVAWCTLLPKDICERLVDWTLEVAERKNFILDGFRVQRERTFLIALPMKADEDHVPKLRRLWSSRDSYTAIG